jgi:hypothetical protein
LRWAGLVPLYGGRLDQLNGCAHRMWGGYGVTTQVNILGLGRCHCVYCAFFSRAG